MELRIFLLADFANVDAGHKLNVIGVFSTIWARKFPVVHPSMYLVAKVAADLGEFGTQRDYKIIFYDEDAHELGKIEGTFAFPQPKGIHQKSEFNVVIALRDLQFQTEGRYEFRLLVNEHLLGVLPLDVIETPEPSRE